MLQIFWVATSTHNRQDYLPLLPSIENVGYGAPVRSMSSCWQRALLRMRSVINLSSYGMMKNLQLMRSEIIIHSIKLKMLYITRATIETIFAKHYTSRFLKPAFIILSYTNSQEIMRECPNRGGHYMKKSGRGLTGMN